MNPILTPTEDAGIVLRLYASRDADLVLHVFFQRLGKLSVLARQARRSRKRFGASFDLFDRGVFLLAPSRGSLPLVNSFSPQRLLAGLSANLDRLSAASVLCEAFDVLVKEGMEASGRLYSTLDLALDAINEASDTREMLRAAYFAVHDLLVQCGYLDAGITPAPTARNLAVLLNKVQDHSERELISRSALEQTIRRLQAERSEPPEKADGTA